MTTQNCTGIGLKSAPSCDSASLRAANGSAAGCTAAPALTGSASAASLTSAARPQPIASLLMPPSSGASATAASAETGAHRPALIRRMPAQVVTVRPVLAMLGAAMVAGGCIGAVLARVLP